MGSARPRLAKSTIAVGSANGGINLCDNYLDWHRVVQSAVWAAHDLRDSDIELSPFYVASEVRAHYAGMMMAVAVAAWEQYDALSASRLGRVLRQIAAHANPMALRKHPRGPKPPKKKGYVPGAVARRHVSTARVLKEGIVNSDL
jgi:hypothetical protein